MVCVLGGLRVEGFKGFEGFNGSKVCGCFVDLGVENQISIL